MIRRAAAGVFLAIVVAGCTSQAAAPPPPPVTGHPEQLVVLGGADAYGADLPRDDRLRRSWPQLVLAQLPPGSTMTNLATSGASMADVVERQVPEATSLRPTLAVVSLDATGDGDPAVVDQVVDALRAAGAATVVVLDPSPSAGASSDNGDGGRPGVVVVDTSTVSSSGISAHQQIAADVANALGHS